MVTLLTPLNLGKKEKELKGEEERERKNQKRK